MMVSVGLQESPAGLSKRATSQFQFALSYFGADR